MRIMTDEAKIKDENVCLYCGFVNLDFDTLELSGEDNAFHQINGLS